MGCTNVILNLLFHDQKKMCEFVVMTESYRYWKTLLQRRMWSPGLELSSALALGRYLKK